MSSPPPRPAASKTPAGAADGAVGVTAPAGAAANVLLPGGTVNGPALQALSHAMSTQQRSLEVTGQPCWGGSKEMMSLFERLKEDLSLDVGYTWKSLELRLLRAQAERPLNEHEMAVQRWMETTAGSWAVKVTGSTPLHFASGNGDVEIVRYLAHQSWG
eukprot:jgi/Mesvir1/16474/Mv10033-RA.1